MTTIVNLARLRTTAIHYGRLHRSFETEPATINALIDIAEAAQGLLDARNRDDADEARDALKDALSVVAFEDHE